MVLFPTVAGTPSQRTGDGAAGGSLALVPADSPRMDLLGRSTPVNVDPRAASS